ncbi:hypothetical protein ACTFIY_002910 [Dictyostelium cf. discoideum]
MVLKKILFILILSLLFSLVLSEEIKNNENDAKSFVIEKVIGQIQEYANKYNLNQNQLISVITYACSFKPEKCSIYNNQLPENLLSTAKVILQSKSDEIVKLIQDNIKSNDLKFSAETNKKLERLLISLNLLGGLIGGTNGPPIAASINTQNEPDNRQNAPIAQNFQSYQQNQPISNQIPNQIPSQNQNQNQNQQNPTSQDRQAQLEAQLQMERDYRESQHRREMEEKARLAALALQQQLERQQNEEDQEEFDELVPILNEIPDIPVQTTPQPSIPVKTKPPQTEQPTSAPTLPPQPQPSQNTQSPVVQTNSPKSESTLSDYASYFDQFLDIVDLFTQKYNKQHQQQQDKKAENNNNQIDNFEIENDLSKVSPALSNKIK